MAATISDDTTIDIPPQVVQLAVGCFVQAFGPHELLRLSPAEQIEVAKRCNLECEQFIEAVQWLQARWSLDVSCTHRAMRGQLDA